MAEHEAMTLEKAVKIADAINSWAGGSLYYRRIVTIDDVMKMKPLPGSGCEVYAVQFGNVSIAVRADNMTCQFLQW